MARATAAQRARRLLALLGQLQPGARVEIDALARQLGTSPAELAEDLETLSMCGVGEFMPDELVPIMVEDGYVETFGALPAVSGSIRLSGAEAAALAAALQTVGVSASDPLAAKLAEAASPEFDPAELEHQIRYAVDEGRRSVFQLLARALDEGIVIELSYAGAGQAEGTVRVVEPMALFAERGAWYLTGWCRQRGGWRTFRVDRIREVKLTGEHVTRDPDGAPVSAAVWAAAGQIPLATLRFAAGERFSDRDWPGAQVVSTEADGVRTVTVPFAGTEWIARRVAARMGRVELIEPADARAAVAAICREALLGP
jgi:predicted DNA-binding transcriptional regulator YafY